jgi:choline dehydrogenase
VIAGRLVEAGRRVLVLEAGPDHGGYDEGRWPADLIDARTLPFSHDWGYTSGDELPGRGLAYPQARSPTNGLA